MHQPQNGGTAARWAAVGLLILSVAHGPESRGQQETGATATRRADPRVIGRNPQLPWGPIGYFALLDDRRVQDSLKLTERQKRQIAAVRREFEGKVARLQSGPAATPQPARPETPEDRIRAREEARAEINKGDIIAREMELLNNRMETAQALHTAALGQIERALGPANYQRLQGLYCRAHGAMILLHEPALFQDWGLEDWQLVRLREIGGQRTNQSQQAAKDYRKKTAEAFLAAHRARAKVDPRLSVADQKKAQDELARTRERNDAEARRKHQEELAASDARTAQAAFSVLTRAQQGFYLRLLGRPYQWEVDEDAGKPTPPTTRFRSPDGEKGQP